jgi:hypothetical protein
MLQGALAADTESLAARLGQLQSSIRARVANLAGIEAPSKLQLKESKLLSKSLAVLESIASADPLVIAKTIGKAVALVGKSKTSDPAVRGDLTDVLACGIEVARAIEGAVEAIRDALQSPVFRAKVERLLDKSDLTLDQALGLLETDPAAAAKLIVKAIFSYDKNQTVAEKLLAVESRPGRCRSPEGSMTASVDGAPFSSDAIKADVTINALGRILYIILDGTFGTGETQQRMHMSWGINFTGFTGPGEYTLGGQNTDVHAQWWPQFGLVYNATSGSIVVTSFDLEARSMSGTYFFTGAPPVSGPNIEVAAGEFSITCFNVRDSAGGR